MRRALPELCDQTIGCAAFLTTGEGSRLGHVYCDLGQVGQLLRTSVLLSYKARGRVRWTWEADQL